MHPRATEFIALVEERYGLEVDVLELPDGTKTAHDAAEAIGCDLAQIVKSMAMSVDENIVLVLTSGPNRVDEHALAASYEVDPTAVEPADPDRVKSVLGWSIGGIPPISHNTDVPTQIDPDLLDHEIVWAGAGTPNAVFGIEPPQLTSLTEATTATCIIEG